MKPKHWQLLQHTVSVPPGLKNAHHQWDELTRLYLLISDGQGNTGIGEATPLPGLSPDTALVCKTTLSQFLPLFMNKAISSPQDIATVAAVFPSALPAARFALETALLDLLAQSRNIPLWALFVPEPCPVRVNALLSEDTLEADAHRLFNSGIRVFKLKVGARNNFRSEVGHLQWLRETFGDDIVIRLDANGALAGPHMAHKLDELSRFNPEYIEEPAPFAALVPGQLRVPYAFDESLIQIKNPHAIEAHPLCKALILKPTLLGGFFHLQKLTEIAEQSNRQAVITHSFESLPGFLAAVHLAVSVRAKSICGLHPHPALDAVDASTFFELNGDAIQLKTHPGLGVRPEDIINLDIGES